MMSGKQANIQIDYEKYWIHWIMTEFYTLFCNFID